MPAQIALQMFTLRDHAKTPRDLARTLARVKQIGYDAVQMSGHGPIDPAELAKILASEGLTCAATHVPFDRLRDHVDAVIDDHERWNCSLTALGGFGWDGSLTAAQWSDFARTFEVLAKRYAAGGVQLGYHNHNHEMVRFGQQTALDLIAASAPSAWMEIDTYWITSGGGDPAAWVNKFPGRHPAVHFKDMAIGPGKKQLMAEVGEGNLNWPAILAAVEVAGTRWIIIEQDDTNGRDPFESIVVSLRNLRAMIG